VSAMLATDVPSAMAFRPLSPLPCAHAAGPLQASPRCPLGGHMHALSRRALRLWAPLRRTELAMSPGSGLEASTAASRFRKARCSNSPTRRLSIQSVPPRQKRRRWRQLSTQHPRMWTGNALADAISKGGPQVCRELFSGTKEKQRGLTSPPSHRLESASSLECCRGDASQYAPH
jgi:hypothetical protein